MDDIIDQFDMLQLHETRRQYEKHIRTLQEDNKKLRAEIQVLVKTLRYTQHLLRTFEERKQKIPNWIY